MKAVLIVCILIITLQNKYLHENVLAKFYMLAYFQ